MNPELRDIYVFWSALAQSEGNYSLIQPEGPALSEAEGAIQALAQDVSPG
jgi:hypothetical protein